MTEPKNTSTAEDRRRRLQEAMRLQEIENSPLSAEQVALFEMFEWEGWSDAQCLAHLHERARGRAKGSFGAGLHRLS